MDGVLTNLDGAVRKMCGLTSQEVFNKGGEKLLFDVFNEGKIDFWSEMDWMPNGYNLWLSIKSYNPTILSAVNDEIPYAKHGKKKWIENNLGYIDHILCLRKEKQNYANKYSILIDDHKNNIEEWKEKGGIGILYKDEAFQEISNIIQKIINNIV